MTDYQFKQWLTVEEAAAWLTDHAGKPYTAEAVRRAIQKGFIQGYYSPEGGHELGVFVRRYAHLGNHHAITDLDHLVCPCAPDEHRRAGQPLILLGPVPFSDLAGLEECAKKSPAGSFGVAANGTDGGVIGEIYALGKNFEPLSLASINYKILIMTRNLEDFSAALPDTDYRSPPPIHFADFSWTACSEMYADEFMSLGVDQPFQAQALQPSQRRTDAPALEALAFAAHLIANLAERLDEAEGTPSKKLGLKLSGKPNVRKIAAELESTAAGLNYTGHGYGASGFQDKLGRALRSIDTPE